MEAGDHSHNCSSNGGNWSTDVEDLLDGGDVGGAISLLESLVTMLETEHPADSDLQLASALSDLANLYSSKGFSLKADQVLSRASLIKLRSQQSFPSQSDVHNVNNESKEDSVLLGNCSAHEGTLGNGKNTNLLNVALQEPVNGSSDDDWEAIADRAPDELLPAPSLPAVSNLSLDDSKVQKPKLRGRGTFSYRKGELYSDRLSDGCNIAVSDDENVHHNLEGSTETNHFRYGTHHVLVLANFPPTTRTTELEKLFENFRDCGVVIRWVNDTVALAVFRSPSTALEACNNVRCPFTVRILEEDDTLLSSIRARDLDPPRPRPKTSARTANRLIAQGMGLKLPSTTFGSRELRKQEEARRNRIVTRQNMRDDAWGGDDVN